MEMMTRIFINSILLFISAYVGASAAIHILRKEKNCNPRATFISRLVVIWCIGFLILAWDWVVSGRVFMLPVQIEILWSFLMLLAIAIYKEALDMFVSCPLQYRPIGEILIQKGVASEKDIEEALNAQAEEKKEILIH